jgi:hypothetical protein
MIYRMNLKIERFFNDWKYKFWIYNLINNFNWIYFFINIYNPYNEDLNDLC